MGGVRRGGRRRRGAGRARQHGRPRAAGEALRAGGTTLVHGDLRDDNLGFLDGRVVLLDWDIAGEGTPALEVAWYLCHDAWRTQGTHDELLEDFLAAEGGAVSERDLDLGLIAGLQLYGWIFGHSAVIHPDPGRARVGARGARVVGAARARRARAHRRGGVMRAAVLHGPDDLRVEEVDEPAGEVLVEVRAATACGTDRKMLRHGHRILGDYPARFGHETAGVRVDTGERVFVGDSVACGVCGPCRAGRAAICRAPTWVLGGFAERIAAPLGALHAIPDGLDFAGAAMAEPLAACVHAHGPRHRRGGRRRARRRDDRAHARAPAGARRPRRPRLRPPPRAPRPGARPSARGRRTRWASTTSSSRRSGRVEAWEQAVAATRPGGTAVLVGGCPGGTTVQLATAPLHYDEVDVRGAFHHTRAEIDRALALLAAGDVDWHALAGDVVGLEDLAGALQAPTAGEARKLVVDPSR